MSFLTAFFTSKSVVSNLSVRSVFYKLLALGNRSETRSWFMSYSWLTTIRSLQCSCSRHNFNSTLFSCMSYSLNPVLRSVRIILVIFLIIIHILWRIFRNLISNSSLSCKNTRLSSVNKPFSLIPSRIIIFFVTVHSICFIISFQNTPFLPSIFCSSRPLRAQHSLRWITVAYIWLGRIWSNFIFDVYL